MSEPVSCISMKFITEFQLEGGAGGVYVYTKNCSCAYANASLPCSSGRLNGLELAHFSFGRLNFVADMNYGSRWTITSGEISDLQHEFWSWVMNILLLDDVKCMFNNVWDIFLLEISRHSKYMLQEI